MSVASIEELDVVRLRRQVVGDNHTWPAGSEGTVVAANIPAVLIEFTRRPTGQTLDLVWVDRASVDVVAPATEPA